MEIYILDPLFRRTKVVDKFSSLIWTERWNAFGDFELDLKSTLENRGNFMTGTHLAINTSHRVMVVETVEDETRETGEKILKVKGRSLEKILEDRVFKDTLASFNTPILTGTPGDIAREMFDHICRNPAALDPADEIPFLQPGSIFPAGSIPENQNEIRWEQEVAPLYNAIRAVCTTYDLGFRLVRNFDTSELYFDVYTGFDRTTQQTEIDPVIFDTNLQNLRSTTEFNSTQKAKNVAYVFSSEGYEIVYAEGVDPDIDGFDRKVLFVQANYDPSAPSWQASLIQAGNEALLNSRAVSMFDGEVDQRSSYKYGVDYELGDLVEMRNKDGIITKKRVTEQIFVTDEQGERSYPTLAMDVFQGVDSWLSYGNDITAWEDMTAETWSEM